MHNSIKKLPIDIRPGDVILTGQRHNPQHTVKDIELCGNLWRTHVHIDGGCYDGRLPLNVAV